MTVSRRRPDLSVIVVTWRCAELAETTVRRVLERHSALEVEVLVVDNASGDGTAEMLRTTFSEHDPRVRIMDAGANLGFPRANNLALDRARGRHVLFLNPDTEVGEGTLEACVAELDAHPDVGVVGCRLEGADGSVQYEGGRRAYRLRDLLWEGLYLHVIFPRSPVFAHHLMGEWDHAGVRDVEAVSGAYVMTPRALALRLGGFPDDLFMYHEDLAYCLRVGRAGYRIRYRGDLVTMHHTAASSSRHPAPLELLEGEVRVRLLRERGGWPAGAVARALFALRETVRLAAALPAAALPPVRRRLPQVADVGKHLRLLAWTVWPGAVRGPLRAAGLPEDERPGLLVVGPTPPPVHGVSAYTAMLTAFLPLRARFRVRLVDTSDRRPIETIGRVDLVNVLLGLRHLGELVAALLAHRPAVTLIPVSQNGPAFLRDALFTAAARLLGSRVVLHLHGGAYRAFRDGAPGWLAAVIRATHRAVDAFWVLGEGLRGEAEGLVPAERVRVVPNGVPDPWEGGAPPGPASEGEEAGEGMAARDAPLRVLHLGQVSGTKGVDVLLDAADLLLGRGVPLALTVAGGWGTPGDRTRLEPRLARLAATGHATAPGVVSGAAKRALLEGAEVFVLASVAAEGQPLAVLEAMAAGVPVVATPRGAIPDLVAEGETGLLVPPGDADALARALETLARDPALRGRMGRAGRARYEERFTERRALARATEELVRVVG